MPSPSTVPPVTANEFLPESADLTTCIGAVERPGCGNENRGGWHQSLVFVVLVLALALVFIRIAVGVRRGRRTAAGAEVPGGEGDTEPDRGIDTEPYGGKDTEHDIGQPDGEQASA
jgi:hypothetical protein